MHKSSPVCVLLSAALRFAFVVCCVNVLFLAPWHKSDKCAIIQMYRDFSQEIGSGFLTFSFLKLLQKFTKDNHSPFLPCMKSFYCLSQALWCFYHWHRGSTDPTITLLFSYSLWGCAWQSVQDDQETHRWQENPLKNADGVRQ